MLRPVLVVLSAFPVLLWPVLLLLVAAGCTADAIPGGISPDNKQFIEESWSLYQRHDPRWPDARERWLSLGQPERACLMDNLFIDMNRLAARSVSTPDGEQPGWLRPAQEFIKIGGEGVPFIVGALRKLRDRLLIEACSHVLGATAQVEDLEPLVLDDDAEILGRTQAVRLLARSEEPRALDLLLRLVVSSEPWQIRAAAAESLGACGRKDPAACRAALGSALGDEDPFVAGKAREAISRLQGTADPSPRTSETRSGAER